MAKKNKNKTGIGEKRPKLFDDQTQKKIGEHLTNIDDTISEQDIRNIKTDISSMDTIEEKEREAEETNDETTEENPEADEKNKPISPWNILDAD